MSTLTLQEENDIVASHLRWFCHWLISQCKRRLPTWSNFVRTCAKVVAVTVAIGSGITTGIACSTTALLAGAGWPLFLIVGLASFLINCFVYWQSVQQTFDNLFVKNVFRDLTRTQKALMGVSLVFAISSGLAVGAITYTSTIAMVTHIIGLLGYASVLASSPWIAALVATIFAGVTCFATASLMFNTSHDTIKSNTLDDLKQFFAELTQLKKANGEPVATKEKVIHAIKGICKIIFLALGLTIAIIAAITTLGALWKALQNFLTGFMASPLAAKIISAIIVLGFTAAARVPFVIDKTCRLFLPIGEFIGSALVWCGSTIAWCFTHPKDIWPTCKQSVSNAVNTVKTCFETPEQAIETIENSLDFIGMSLIIGGALVLNAVGNGAIAEKGGQMLSDLIPCGDNPETPSILALGSASCVSFAIGVDSIKKNEGLQETAVYRKLFAKPKAPDQKLRHLDVTLQL